MGEFLNLNKSEKDKLKTILLNHQKCSYEDSNLSHNNLIGTNYRNLFCLLDLNYYPITVYCVNANIMHSMLSDSGKYAIFNTMNTKENDNNENSLFFIDLEEKKVIWQKSGLPHSKYSKSVFIDELAHQILVSYDDISLKFNFNGELLTTKSFDDKVLNSKVISPYELLEQCKQLLVDLNEEYSAKTNNEIEKRLDIICNNPKMSKYQISLFYKDLGNVYYSKEQFNQALLAYKKGLELNEKLSVKKLIKELESKLEK